MSVLSHSKVLTNSKLKALLLSAIFSVMLPSCYMQPQPVDMATEHKAKLHPQHTYRVAGHYMQRINGLNNKDNSTIMVHVDKVGLLSPAKTIIFSVSTTNINTPNQPACDYQGTATLMGQDALHGIVYTAPISELIHSVNANQLVNTTADNSLKSEAKEGLLFLRFKDNILSIDSNNPQILETICTGDLSLKGDYAALNQ